MSKKAFITGIAGQDGSYLAEMLLGKGYEVHGFVRRTSPDNSQNIEHLKARLILHYGDMSNEHHLCSLIHEIQPDEVYNLASQSDVAVSFEAPEYTGDVTGVGVTRVLEAVRKFSPASRFYQASTSELFGNTAPPQSESSLMCPRSPYGVAKLYGYWMTKVYRESYGLFAANGILFNHESPRRGENFVTRKITRAISSIKGGKQDVLHLGNLDAKRDWGYAPEYCEAMWLVLQANGPDDFVIGSGETHTVKEFVEEAFSYAGLDWHKHVKIDSKLYRPCEVNYLQADPQKAQERLGWKPNVTFKELVRVMVDADLMSGK